MNVFLPNKAVNLHATTLDMDRNRIIGRMYGQYNVRDGYWYPQSPYSVRRTVGVEVAPHLGALGFSYYDLLDQAGREDCDPRDSNCVTRNQERVTAVQDLWMTQYMTHPETAGQAAPKININLDTSNRAYDSYMNNAPVTDESIGVNGGTPFVVSNLEHQGSGAGAGSGSSGGGGGYYSPRVSFSTSTGDTYQLKPGNTWVIRITGGAPNSPVVVRGGQNGRNDVTPMGSTDGNGNWQSSGNIDASMIGNWAESWTVGGTNAGSINFTVVAATQAQQSQATGQPNASVPPGSALTPGSTGFSNTGQQLANGTGTSGGVGPFDLSGLLGSGNNNTLLLVAAGLAALMIFGKGK